MKRNIAIAAALVFSGLAIQGRTVVVRGNLMTSEISGAVYEITSDGASTLLTNPAYATSYAASGGGCYHDGRYYMSKIWMSGYAAQTYEFNTAQVPWTTFETDANGSSSILSTDYSFDAERNQLVGFIKISGNNYGIAFITPGASWTRRFMQVQQGPDMVDVKIDCTDPANRWHGIAFDAQNQLWVLTYGGGLYQVDTVTGAMTLVGETGIQPTVNGSAAFDMKTGKLYWAVKNAEESVVYEVDTTTAAAVKVLDVPENKQMMGIYIPEAPAEDGAPAAASNLRFELDGGSLSGNFLFDIPAMTFDEQAAEGPVNYSVTIGTSEPVAGTSTFGAEGVSIPFTVEESGMVEATVTLSNSVGDSPVAKKSAYVGYGVPEAPQNIALVYEDGMMKLTWDAVTTAVNDEGYVGEILYVVTRTVGGECEVVASGLNVPSFQEEIAEPETGFLAYSYSIVADNEGRVSAAATSPSVTLGSLALPYENNFSTLEDFEAFTAINVEPASKTWVYSASGANVTLGYDTKYTKDDWLITPPVKVIQGYQYSVSVVAKSSSATYKEQVGLSWGLAPTAEGMTEEINDGSLLLPNENTTVEGTFIAPETQTIYIGIHACSKKDMYNLTIDDFAISDGEAVSVATLGDGESDLRLIARRGAVRLEGNGSAEIVSVAGISQNVKVAGSAEVSLLPGLYIVRTQNATRKVVVR